MTDPIVQPLNPDSSASLPRRPAPARDFATVYREHHGFVWRTLRHLGVDPDRVDDALQDTFLVVHRRLGEFEGRAALTTWLFEIARRVAARYRRTAAREASRHGELHDFHDAARIDEHLERTEAAEILRIFLADLDRDKSVVFVLAELEQWQVTEIADALQLNVNTVHARLRAARKLLDRLVHRLRAREQRHRFRSGTEVLAAIAIPVAPPLPPGSAELVAGSAVDRLAASDLEWTEFAGRRLADSVAGAAKLGVASGATKVVLTGVCLAAALGGVASLTAPAVRPGPEASEPTTRASAANDERTPVADNTHSVAEAAVGPNEQRSTSPGKPVGERRAPAHSPRRGERVDDAAALAAELDTIEAARAALLAGDAREALARIADYRRRFPDGALAEEAAAARIEALCLLGERGRARREADAFARRWPGSSLAARVVSLCAP